jgi:hypothetical protein
LAENAAHLLNELHKIVNPVTSRSNEVNQVVMTNLRWIFDHHPEPRPFRVILASLVARDVVTLKEATILTGVTSSTISFHNQRPKEELLNALKYCGRLLALHFKENVKNMLITI